MDDPDFGMTPLSRKTLSDFLETDSNTVRMVMEREFAKSKEKVRLKEKRRKPVAVKKLAEKLKTTRTTVDKKGGDLVAKLPDSVSEDTPGSVDISADNVASVVVETERSNAGDGVGVSDPKSTTKMRKTARDKFRRCENCKEEIADRIQLCSGCKKVAYCNSHCQKSHWKTHRRTCLYVQKSTSSAPREKGRVCGSCDRELSDKVMMCAGCKKVAYCDTVCQKTHWKQHKKTCSYAKKKESESKQ